MKCIKAKPITAENFQLYGQFTDLLNPSGYSLGDFYQDRVKMSVSGDYAVAFSPLVVHKQDPMIVTQAEYHNTTQEGILCLDDDFVLHVAPPSKEPVPEQTEAFIVPKGTMPLHQETAHVLIVLPERIYKNDCIVVDYSEEQQVRIEL